MNFVATQKIYLIIPYYVHQKLMYWVKKAKYEITGLGILHYDPDKSNIAVVEDIYLGAQKTSAAAADIEEIDVSGIMGRVSEKGIDLAKLKLWWHSHNDMGVFWSAKDKSTINDFDPDSFFMSLVVNKKGDMLARYDLFHPLRVIVDEINVEIKYPELKKKQIETMDIEFDEYVDETPARYINNWNGDRRKWDEKSQAWAAMLPFKPGTSKHTQAKLLDTVCPICFGQGTNWEKGTGDIVGGHAKCNKCDGKGYIIPEDLKHLFVDTPKPKTSRGNALVSPLKHKKF